MNLDEHGLFSSLDTLDMYAEIVSLPDQLESAWNLGMTLELPVWSGIKNVLISGMGGSAIGGDLLIEFIKDQCPIPVFLHRDYDLPSWAEGESTLVVACSHSGNTEETLTAFQLARVRGCRTVVISTGGKLVDQAQEEGSPAFVFHHKGQPRAAIGYSFGLLLALIYRLGLINDPKGQLLDAINTMRFNLPEYLADIPVVHNPAKRLAGQLIGRDITVVGAGFLGVIARRWKCQLNELAKCWAAFEYLPEADHNTMAGLLNPEDLLYKRMVVFLQSNFLHPRNQLRTKITQEKFMVEGLGTDFYASSGNTILAHMWSALQFGDFVSFYLAMLYDTDPTPIPTIQDLKRALNNG